MAAGGIIAPIRYEWSCALSAAIERAVGAHVCLFAMSGAVLSLPLLSVQLGHRYLYWLIEWYIRGLLRPGGGYFTEWTYSILLIGYRVACTTYVIEWPALLSTPRNLQPHQQQ